MKKLLFILGMCLSINANALTFKVLEDGEIYGYAAGSTAAYDSKLSLLINGVQTVNYIHNHQTPIGTQIYFGFANAGDLIEFRLDVTTTGDTFYSNHLLNLDGVQHAQHTQYGNLLYVGFEDLWRGGDFDYDDNSAYLSNVAAVVPEPDAYMMVLVGLLLIAFSARATTRKTIKGIQSMEAIWKKEAKEEVAFFLMAVAVFYGAYVAINY